MKQTLLLFLFSFLTLAGFAQKSAACDNCPQATAVFASQPKISVFPNPTTAFISVSNDEVVGEIRLYSLTGRMVKTFKAQSGSKYSVADLQNGMYLIQIIDKKKNIIVTQRLSKR